MPYSRVNGVLGQHAVAIARSHAGEVLQGAIRSNEGTRRLLLSLPAPSLWTRAEVRSTPGTPMTILPAWAHKTRSAVHRLLQHLHLEPPKATIRLTTNIPVGKGCGSSTADILAAVRALLRYLGETLEEETVAKLIVEVENASDGTVLTRPALFRHREGVVEEYLHGDFPPMSVVVIDTQPTEKISTTLMKRARYSDMQLEAFDSLLVRLRRAFREGCPYCIGDVATASARVSQQFLPKPHLDSLLKVVDAARGYGVAVAHSGTVASVLLPVDCNTEGRTHITTAAAYLGMRVLTEYRLGTEEQPIAA